MAGQGLGTGPANPTTKTVTVQLLDTGWTAHCYEGSEWFGSKKCSSREEAVEILKTMLSARGIQEEPIFIDV